MKDLVASVTPHDIHVSQTLSFPPITKREIEQEIWKASRSQIRYWRVRDSVITIGLGGVVVLVGTPLSEIGRLCLLGGIGLLVTLRLFQIGLLPPYEINLMPLAEWKRPLSRGVQLLVQEARQQDYRDFYVWYPERASTDPVLTAYAPDNTLRHICTWT